MPFRAVGKIAVSLCAVVYCQTRLYADDITTTNGKVFRNAEVVKFDPDGVAIKYEGGTKLIVWKDLPEPLRQRYQTEARKRKEAEIEKLKQDLARAEAEAAKLGGETVKNATPPPVGPEKTSVSRAAPDKPAKPAGDLPPLESGDVVDAGEMILQFKIDATSSAQRYRKKSFRVRGVVAGFEPKMFVRKYDVLLESVEKNIRLVAGFDYSDDFKAVYTTRHGQWLAGKRTDRAEVTLLKVGDTIVFEGKCKGLSDSEIAFSGCRLVR